MRCLRANHLVRPRRPTPALLGTAAAAPQPYPDEADDIDNAVQPMAGTRGGRAAAQFTTYADHVGTALGDQQDVVGSVSGILSGIAGCIIETYSKAIEFIGTCAVELGKLGYKTIVAIPLPPMPTNSGMDNEKQWRIDPSAAPA